MLSAYTANAFPTFPAAHSGKLILESSLQCIDLSIRRSLPPSNQHALPHAPQRFCWFSHTPPHSANRFGCRAIQQIHSRTFQICQERPYQIIHTLPRAATSFCCQSPCTHLPQHAGILLARQIHVPTRSHAHSTDSVNSIRQPDTSPVKPSSKLVHCGPLCFPPGLIPFKPVRSCFQQASPIQQGLRTLQSGSPWFRTCTSWINSVHIQLKIFSKHLNRFTLVYYIFNRFILVSDPFKLVQSSFIPILVVSMHFHPFLSRSSLV